MIKEALLTVNNKLLGFEFYRTGCLLFTLLYLELFLFHRFRLGLASWLLTLLLLILLFFLFYLLLFRNFGLLGPFFDQRAVFKSDQTVLSELDLEGDSKGFMLRVLGWGFVVTDVFVESIDWSLLSNKDLFAYPILYSTFFSIKLPIFLLLYGFRRSEPEGDFMKFTFRFSIYFVYSLNVTWLLSTGYSRDK